MLSFKNISLQYEDRILFDSLSCSWELGQWITVLGKNAIGKSSLLRSLAGMLRPSSGRLLLDGEDIYQMTPRRRFELTSYLGQNINFDYFHGQVSDFIDLLGVCWKFSFKELPFKRHDFVSTLSQGSQKILYLLCLLSKKSPLILLDEPNNHLDPYFQDFIYQQLVEKIKQRALIVEVSHGRERIQDELASCYYVEEQTLKKLAKGQDTEHIYRPDMDGSP